MPALYDPPAGQLLLAIYGTQPEPRTPRCRSALMGANVRLQGAHLHGFRRIGATIGISLGLLALAQASCLATPNPRPSSGPNTHNPRWRVTFTSIGPRDTVLGLTVDSVLHPPARPQRLHLRVRATVNHDREHGLYTYSYRVTNLASSDSCLDEFGLAPVTKPDSMATPEEWWRFCCEYQGRSNAVVWTAAGFDTTRPPANWNGYQLPRPPASTCPGGSVSGFALVSSRPPANISFYATQFDTIPHDYDTWRSPDLFVEGISGTIVGPAPSSKSLIKSPNPRALIFDSESKPPPDEALITYFLPTRAHLVVAVHAESGQRIALLRDADLDPGQHEHRWRGLDSAGHHVPPGDYVVRISAAGRLQAQRRIRVPS